MKAKLVSKRFTDISNMIDSTVLAKYATMDFEQLQKEHIRVLKEMANVEFPIVDTDLVLELYHITTNAFERLAGKLEPVKG